MKSYVYRIWPEDDRHKTVYRDILIQEDKTMEDFHSAILDAFGLAEGEMASFFTCTNEWDEGLEIMLMDMGTMEHEAVNILMQELTIATSVEQDIKYYIFMYDFLFPKRFKIERIGENKKIKENIPVLLAEVGVYEVENSFDDALGLDDFEGEKKPKKEKKLTADDYLEGYEDLDYDDDEPSFENIDDYDL